MPRCWELKDCVPSPWGLGTTDILPNLAQTLRCCLDCIVFLPLDKTCLSLPPETLWVHNTLPALLIEHEHVIWSLHGIQEVFIFFESPKYVRVKGRSYNCLATVWFLKLEICLHWKYSDSVKTPGSCQGLTARVPKARSKKHKGRTSCAPQTQHLTQAWSWEHMLPDSCLEGAFNSVRKLDSRLPVFFYTWIQNCTKEVSGFLFNLHMPSWFFCVCVMGITMVWTLKMAKSEAGCIIHKTYSFIISNILQRSYDLET